MQSIVSYPDRGQYGNNRYRGNCSGRIIEDIIEQYNIRQLSDFMVGGGTTEDVVRTKGLEGCFADLNRGYDMMSMDIPERSENIFWHPPYGSMIQYSDNMYRSKDILDKYGIDCKEADLSRCKDWDSFIRKLNYCMLKQFESLDKGGRMFVLMGDMKKQGRLYSMLCDIVKPGQLEQIIIKAQHNCWSDSQVYSHQNFVPIIHEYLMVVKKESSLIIPVAYGLHKTFNYLEHACCSWRDLIHDLIENKAGEMSLEELYSEVNKCPKTDSNPHWREKVRQVVQNARYFKRTARGCYALA